MIKILLILLIPALVFAEQITIDVDIDITKFYELKAQYEEDLRRVNYIIENYEQQKGVLNGNAETEDTMEQQQENQEGTGE